MKGSVPSTDFIDRIASVAEIQALKFIKIMNYPASSGG
jgi:hypothetical protein